MGSNNPRQVRGFTLMEFIVVLMIGSLIVSLGVPAFNGAIDNQRMTASTNEFVMTLTLAKSEAIKRVGYVTVCKSSSGTGCTGGGSWDDGWIVFANDGVAGLNSLDAGEEIIRVYPALHDEISLNLTGTLGDFISFRPSGTVGTAAANMSGMIVTCDDRGGHHGRAIVLTTSGKWRVARGDETTAAGGDGAGGAALFTCP